MKTIGREEILRMVGDRVGGGSSSSGISGGGGGVSMGWVEGNFVSKEFFNQLFNIHGTRTYVDEETEEEVTEEVVITPNQIIDGEEYNLSNVEVSVGLWTKQFLSALGLNPAGGGGGGVTALTDLTDVQITDLQPGQILKYSNGKWRNVDDTPSGVTSVGLSMPTGFAVNGSPVTNRGTLQVTFASGYSLPSNARQNEWDTVYNWYSENPLGGYATQSWVNSQGFLKSSALNGYATQAWVNSQGFLKSGDSARLRAIEFSAVPSTANDGGYIDFHFNGSSADYTSRIIENTAAGQLIVNNAAAFYLNAVTGANIMSPVTDFSSRNFRVRITNSLLADTICLSGPLVMRNAQGIRMIDTGGTELRALRLDTGNNLVLGENFQNYGVYLRGNALYFQTGTSNTESLRVDANGNILQTRNNTAYILRNTSNGNVTVMRLDNNNVFELGYGTVSPDYATSIFGGSTKGIGLYAGSTLVASIYRDADRNGLRIGNALLSWDSKHNALCVQRYDGAAMDIYATGGVSALGFSAGVSQIDSMTFNYLTVNNNLAVGGNQTVGGTLTVTNTTTLNGQTIMNSALTVNGNIRGQRYYLDASRYLHVSSGHLYFYNGSTDTMIV